MTTVRSVILTIGFLVPLGVICSMTHGQSVTYIELGEQLGINPADYQMASGMAGGISAADYDNDGDIDLFAPTACGMPNRLYRNDGDGNFADIAADVGLDSLTPSRVALWFDFDGDHDLDLLVGHDDRDKDNPCPTRPFTLYEQVTTSSFVDVTQAAGLQMPDVSTEGTHPTHASGMCAGDIDNDGYLDVCAVQWNGSSFLFRNNGDGTFDDISAASGFAANGDVSWQPVMCDFNEDGYLDIFVAIDFLPNTLWINQQDGTFIDIAQQAGVAVGWNQMGVTVNDFDNDGRLDMYVTNIDGLGAGGVQKHNELYHNISSDGTVVFEEIAEDLGVSHGFWGWGATMFDANNDSYVDIAATNGFWDEPWASDQSVYFQSNGTEFTDLSEDVGFNDTHWGGGLIAFDCERDGDLDLVQACNDSGGLRVLCSHPAAARAAATRGRDRQWLVVRPRMEGANHYAIGAVVKIYMGGRQGTRLITAGTSCLSQEPAEAFFGLGASTSVESIEITWPGGQVSVVEDVASNQVITIIAPPACVGDVTNDGAVDVTDLLTVINNWGQFGEDVQGDANDDGSVSVADLLAVINNWGGC